MGHIIRAQRRGNGNVSTAHTHHRKGAAKFRQLDATERASVINGKVKELIHDPGRGAPLARIVFKKEGLKELDTALIVAPEGIHSGQTISCGPTATLHVGNILPIGKIPEGTEINNVEHRPGDGGKFGRCSGDSCRIIAHGDDGYTRVQLPSGRKTILADGCRATLGVVAGGGRLEKPLLKAGNVYYKYKAKRKSWPVVRGVAMNPVDRKHGGGAHQHMGRPGTVSRNARPGQKIGCIAARRTGRRRGTITVQPTKQ